jgi:hypothetical protein
MVASTALSLNMVVKTLGYYTIGDGGGNFYQIVAASTGTADGGSYIDLTGSGLQAKAIMSGNEVKAEWFGCVDGVIENVKIMKGAKMFELVSQKKDDFNQGLDENKNNNKMFEGITDQTTNYLKDNKIDFGSIDFLNLRDLRILAEFIDKQKEITKFNENSVNFGDVFVSGDTLKKIENQPEVPQKSLKKEDTFSLTSNQWR